MLKDKEGSIIDKRVADEVAKYSKLETEFRLLKREHCKAEVRIKSLQRDLLRIQAHCSSNADSAAAFQTEKKFLVDRITSLGCEREEILAKVEDLSSCLEERENELSNLRRGNDELTAMNANLKIEIEKFRSSSANGPQSRQHELISIGVNTETSPTSSSVSREQWKFEERSKSLSANSQMRLTMGESAMNHNTLETNIMRLTRLADALLGGDE